MAGRRRAWASTPATTTATAASIVVRHEFLARLQHAVREQRRRLLHRCELQAGVAAPSRPYLGWGVGFVDFDNDGLLDIFVANGHVYPEIDRSGLGTKYLQRKQLFKNLGTGRFRDVSDEVGGGLLIEKSSRGAAFGDYRQRRRHRRPRDQHERPPDAAAQRHDQRATTGSR